MNSGEMFRSTENKKFKCHQTSSTAKIQKKVKNQIRKWD